MFYYYTLIDENSCNNGKCPRTRMGEDHIHESLDDDEQTNHEEVDDLQENVDYQSDLAITTSSEDVFKHIHYVKVLKNILQNSTSPLNVGLYGRWGVGKSSYSLYVGRGNKEKTNLLEVISNVFPKNALNLVSVNFKFIPSESDSDEMLTNTKSSL